MLDIAWDEINIASAQKSSLPADDEFDLTGKYCSGLFVRVFMSRHLSSGIESDDC
jgi:hypothetical protein